MHLDAYLGEATELSVEFAHTEHGEIRVGDDVVRGAEAAQRQVAAAAAAAVVTRTALHLFRAAAATD